MDGLCLEKQWWSLSGFHIVNSVSVLTSSQVLVDGFCVMREAALAFAVAVIESCFAEEVFKG